jgi:NADPH-dependent F420 reductase
MTNADLVAELTVAVVGGTGPQGRGLARRWAEAGIRVVIGSRDAQRAESVGADVAAATRGDVTGADNLAAAAQADVVVLAVPWEGHSDLVKSLAPALTGKIVVDCVNPLKFDKLGAYALDVAEGSAAEQTQGMLPESTVVGAFHSVSAVLLNDPALKSVDTDVLVLGDVREATDIVQALASRIPGARGVYGLFAVEGVVRSARRWPGRVEVSRGWG